jgi:P-type Cu+ transporter
MACCVVAAFIINKLISACEKLHIGLDIQYNDAFTPMISSAEDEKHSGEGKLITKLSLTGLTCAACTVAVEAALAELEGVESVRTSLQLQQATVIHDGQKTKDTDLKAAVEDLGYEAEIGQRSADAVLKLLQRGDDLAALRTAFIRSATLLSALFLINEQRVYGSLWRLSIFSTSWSIPSLSVVISGAVQWYCGSFLYRNAWTAATKRRVNMDSLIAFSTSLGLFLSLMSLAIYGAAARSTYFQTCAALTTVVLGGRYFDSLSKKQSGEGLLNLFSHRAENAMVKKRDGKVCHEKLWLESLV